VTAWLELKTEVARQDVDMAEELLLALGALSITNLDAQDQPILEPGPGETPLWDRGGGGWPVSRRPRPG
jgi:ribosomal protein L11 methyltransferase